MADTNRRYTFGPLDKRGLLLGLDGPQIFTLVAGALLSLLIAGVMTGPGRIPAAIAALAGPAVVAVVPVAGRPLIAWVPVTASWLGRRPHRARLAAEPLVGRPLGGDGPRSGPNRLRASGSVAPGIALARLPAEPGSSEIGLVRDTRAKTLAAVIPVRGRSFSLLDPAYQVQLLDSWRAVLGALGRPGSPVQRIQWIERSAPCGAVPASMGPGPAAGDRAPAPAIESYQSLVQRATPSTQTHDVWIVLAVAALRPGRSQAQRPTEVLRRELRLLEGQLRSADLRSGRPLGPDGLADLMGGPPMAVEERWGAIRMDGDWHATFWISEWPRIEVNPDFLAPLLVSAGRRSVSVVMAPVPARKAVREARSARTADLADAEIRSRAGFLPSAHREREADGAIRRERELADGHSEFRFSGYVTVTASDLSELEAACAEAEHSAQAARLDLRRMYGRQAEAFCWTMPIGRGLR